MTTPTNNPPATALALIPRSVDECASLAERLAKSSLLPAALRGKVPDVMMTIMAGQELGLAPMASLRTIHVVDGKPVLSADGMVAIVLGSGRAVYFERVEESESKVTYETLRVGSKAPKRCMWTLEQAKRAGLTSKDNWRLYPRAMLAARAKSELARDVYSDVLAGCYTDDEVPQGERPVYVAPVDAVDAEVISDDVEALLKAVDDAPTLDELTALEPQLKQLTNGHKAEAKRRYAARRDWLKAHATEPNPEQAA